MGTSGDLFLVDVGSGGVDGGEVVVEGEAKCQDNVYAEAHVADGYPHKSNDRPTSIVFLSRV